LISGLIKMYRRHQTAGNYEQNTEYRNGSKATQYVHAAMHVINVPMPYTRDQDSKQQRARNTGSRVKQGGMGK
ncbi:MAG: hypothetical protein QXL94_04245, partial [Candidatus Parvarchaeum sp.]